jgi:iron complex transport system permease protein
MGIAMESRDPRRLPSTAPRPRLTTWLSAALLAAVALSLLAGRYPSPGIQAPWSIPRDGMARNILLLFRAPRVLAAVLLGMSLGASGMVFQTVFGNPLVEPGFLGVSQGAAFGAAAAIVFFGNGRWVVQGAAFVFALTGLAVSHAVAHRVRFGGWVLRLVLAGISVSAFFSAGIGVLKYVADPLHQLPEITFWLLGGLWGVTWGQLLAVMPVSVASLAVIAGYRWRLNLLALGDETAHSLGVSPGRERMLLLACAVASTAVMISVCGVVGWIGLIVPHLARRRLGANTRVSLPGAMIIGSLFTLVCDDLARVALPGEIPLGILTSMAGAALFLVLLVTGEARVRE